MSLFVVKRHGRLVIADESGKVVYAPPEFLRPHITSRAEVQALAERLTGGPDDIDAIVRFETELRP